MIEGNIDVSDLLPESDKKDEEEEETDDDNLQHFDCENKSKETENKEASRKKKKRAKLFILKGFLKPSRILTQ